MTVVNNAVFAIKRTDHYNLDCSISPVDSFTGTCEVQLIARTFDTFTNRDLEPTITRFYFTPADMSRLSQVLAMGSKMVIDEAGFLG